MGRIYSNIGFVGLWNGLPVRIVMIGTLTVSLFGYSPMYLLPKQTPPFVWEKGRREIGETMSNADIDTGIPVAHLRQLQGLAWLAHDWWALAFAILLILISWAGCLLLRKDESVGRTVHTHCREGILIP